MDEKDELIKLLKDALHWCAGSADFGYGGKAHEGWTKIVAPLLSGEPIPQDYPKTLEETP